MIKQYLVLIKNKKFVYLWISQLFSQLASNLLLFLLLIRLYESTNSTLAASLIWVSYALPAMIVGPFAATYVDFIDRRKVLVLTSLAQSLAVCIFALFYKRTVYLAYALAIVFSFFNQFNDPAESASLPFLVSKKKLPYANGLFFITQQAAIVVGFGLAGLISELLGFGLTLFIPSLFLLLAFFSSSFLPVMRTGKKLVEGFEKGVTDFFSQILEGYKFIKRETNVLMGFSLLLVLQVSLSVVTTNMPVIAKEIIEVKPSYSSIFMVVPAGVGAMFAALLVPKLLSTGIRKKRLIQTSLALLTLGIWLMVFIFPLLPLVIKILTAVSAFLVMGYSFLSIVILTQTYVQEVTPKQMMARVFGNFWFLTTVAMVFPVLCSATITDILGVGTLLFLLGCVSLGGLIFSKVYDKFLIQNA